MKMKIKIIALIIIGILWILGCSAPTPPSSKPSPKRVYKSPSNINSNNNSPKRTILSKDKQKEIYYQIVYVQEYDQGCYTIDECNMIIADKYRISIQQVKDITVKGISEGWPIP